MSTKTSYLKSNGIIDWQLKAQLNKLKSKNNNKKKMLCVTYLLYLTFKCINKNVMCNILTLLTLGLLIFYHYFKEKIKVINMEVDSVE